MIDNISTFDGLNRQLKDGDLNHGLTLRGLKSRPLENKIIWIHSPYQYYWCFLVIKIGIVVILNRFATNPMEDDSGAIRDFFPRESGARAFPEAYRVYQPTDQQRFVNHAHNNFLEIVMNMDIFGLIIINSFLILYLTRWFSFLRSKNQEQFRILQISARLGMLLLLLHSYLDFNLRQLANALVFIFLAGIFFRKKEVR